MILPIGLGVWAVNFSDYGEVKRKLRLYGIEPTGDIQVDKSKLRNIIEKKVEKFEITKKEEENQEKLQKENLEENRLGAKTLGEQNKIFFGL